MSGADSVSSKNVSEWFIVLYEWQGAHDLSNCREWFSSSDMFQSEVTAIESVDKLRRKTEPVNGQMRYRNVRGPFVWAEPSPDETSGVVPVADGFEMTLQVEITSDAPDKIHRCRTQLGNMLLNLPALHDVMVTVHEVSIEQSQQETAERCPCGCPPDYCMGAGMLAAMLSPAVQCKRRAQKAGTEPT